MRLLARRAHATKVRVETRLQPLRKRVLTSDKAVVWRHWYTTVNQMLAELDDLSRNDVEVMLLPGETCVAGNWYVSIPQNSPATAEGLELLRMLSSREAEVDRMMRGVGLPTRRSFYSTSADSESESVLSPFFRLSKQKVGRRLESAFRRSEFACYPVLSVGLGVHLRRILELPDAPRRVLRREIKSILHGLVETIRFVGKNGRDEKCQKCSNEPIAGRLFDPR